MDTESVLLRRARSLVFTFSGSQLEVLTLLSKQQAPCTALSIELLSAATDWHPQQSFLDQYPVETRPYVTQELSRLITLGCIVVAGTPLATRDEQYEAEWTWGAKAGLYHFSMKDPDYLPAEVAAEWVMRRIEITPLVPLYATNEGYTTVIQLSDPNLSQGVLAVMRKRRSERAFDPAPIPLEALRDCLFAGLGIMGFLDASIPGMDRFPLKMAPSGGGRNPYEAYVYVRNVADLASGIYHYSALENSLGLHAPPPLPEPCTMVAGQDWADGAAAIIFLVADFKRIMWKYPHPTGYRVGLIEAGHIGQNIAIAAAEHDLVAVPTCAISDTGAEYVLGAHSITQSVVYALVLGNRLPPDHQPPPDVRPFIQSHKDYLDSHHSVASPSVSVVEHSTAGRP